MMFANVGWFVPLTCIIHLFLPLCATSHVLRSPGSRVGHLAFRRDGQNLTGNSTFVTTDSPTCEFSPHDFQTKLGVECQSEVKAIQVCPTSSMSSGQRRELAMNLSSCAVKIYRDVYSCARHIIPAYGLPPFESDDRLGAMATYLNPFSDRVLGKREGQEPAACKNPDILPIFEKAVMPFINDTDGRWLAVEKTPAQYLRCVMQAPEGSVEACVTSSVGKLQWLPDRLIIYGGQRSCSTWVQIMITTIMVMALEIIHLAFEIWWTRRKRKTDPDYGRSFSWVGLFRAVIVGIGTPLVCALIIRTQFPENSLAAALGLYLLTPRAAPIIASVSGIFLSKGFGTQTLLVDLVSAGAALVLFNLPIKVWTGPTTSFASTADRPSTGFLYLGLYLATVPAGIVFFIYQIILILAVVLLIWSMFAKSKNLAKAAGVLVGLWVLMWIWIVSFAIFAIAEVIWLAFYKKKNGGKFPVLEDLREWFSRSGSSIGFVLKRYGYWGWVLVSFATAVGRWMFLNQLLQLTGGAFCPDSLKGATAASILLTWAAIGANVALKLQGLAL